MLRANEVPSSAPISAETAVAFIWRNVGKTNSSLSVAKGSSDGASLNFSAGLVMAGYYQ